MDSSKKRARETHLPNFESHEGIIEPELKNLYSILVNLYSNSQWKVKYAEGSLEKDYIICDEGGFEVTFGDICELSNVLFQELEKNFDKIFSELSGVSAAKDLGESSSTLDLFNAVEVLISLFRCCLLLFVFIGAQQNLLFEKGPVLLNILRRLMSPNLIKNRGKQAFVFEKSVFHECAPQDNGCSTSSVEGFSASIEFLEPCNSLILLKCTMLEVFVDELLAHRQLAGYFKMINSVPGISDMRFKSQSAQGDAGMLMEAICNHFILSFSDEQAFEDFLSRLFCSHSMKLEYPFRPPALSITAAASLCLNPMMASAPKYVQAHLISLVSEAVHIKILKADHKLMNCFLTTFEKSVILYMRHVSSLKTNIFSILHGGSSSNSSHDIAYPPLEFFISSETKDKVDTLMSRLDSSSDDVLNGSFSKMKLDLVSTSLRFVKDCQNAYTISCQEEILTILSCLVLKASESYNDKEIRPIEGTTLQHLYLLTSLLKLMSISLLQAIQCVRHSDDLSCLRSLKDLSSCKEYDLILGTIACFKDLDISLPLQQVLYSAMSSHSMRHKDSKMMFLHFSGLMSLSFVTGLDFLVKACLLTILALLNLFVFEEGDLDALHSLVDSKSSGESLSGLSVVRFQETESDQRSSLVVASRFHKMRSQLSSVIENENNEKESLCLSLASASHMETAGCLEEETEETCNGEIFLKCMPGGNVFKFDDLVDFVECKEGKDYSHWLTNRRRFRKWRYEKMAVLKWKKNKKSRKIVKGKGND
ncbi:hypothetical protein C2S52_014171 [Perilla frutescens var. hirtella]|nr:hypothetical protein C2S52_014171 [Perilla frutescens var. hirtella]